MTCGIYKIENKINGHCYIGQSINIEQRWNNHKKTAHSASPAYDYPLYRAIRKDGIKNFEWTILEKCSQKELNDKERYYIKLYNSLIPNGYNQTIGGQDSFGHPVKLNFEQVEEIKILLKETQLNNVEISNLYNVSETLISAINTGYYWNDLETQYPIRIPEGYFSYRGENGITYYKKKEKYCSQCGKKIDNDNELCIECKRKEHREKNWPDREKLKNLICTIPFTQIGKMYGVTENTPRKWCDKYNLPRRKCDIEKISDEDWELI